MSEKISMTRAVMGAMTNAAGMLFGGELLSWMDELAGIAAKRFSAGDVVTVSVEQVSFLKPIPLGAFIDLEAKVEQVGNTSMQIGLEAWMDVRDLEEDSLERVSTEQKSPDQKRPGQVLAARGTFVYVAVDAKGKPRKVRES